MHDEPKMRGPPANEIPKNPLLRKLNPQAEHKPHNAVEEALQQGAPKAEHRDEHDDPHDERPHKVAIVTGASSGIGKAVALHLASNNYNVVLVARKKEPLHAVEQELAKYRVKTLVHECDVTKIAMVHETVAHTIKTFGRIDVLVNNAGYGIYGDLETMRIEDINGQMLTNYFGTVLFIKECLPKLKESKGCIINIASIAGMLGFEHMAAYSASKHAVVGLSESLRFELEESGVSVSVVCPAKVKTNFHNANESWKDVDWAQDESGIEPSVVASVVLRAIRERKFRYTAPRKYEWQLPLGRLLPESWILDKI